MATFKQVITYRKDGAESTVEIAKNTRSAAERKLRADHGDVEIISVVTKPNLWQWQMFRIQSITKLMALVLN